MKTRIEILDIRRGRTISTIDPDGKLGMIAFSPSGDGAAVLTSAERADPVA